MKSLLVLFSALFVGSSYANHKFTVKHVPRPLDISSGRLSLEKVGSDVIFERVITQKDVSWLRVEFDVASTLVNSNNILRITSGLDGYYQEFSSMDELKKWQGASAYFNGDSVKVQIVSKNKNNQEAFEAPQVTITSLITSEERRETFPPGKSSTESLCSQQDRRELSKFRRDGRLMPVGCTTWVINDPNNCMLTAGHCHHADAKGVVQFQVPLSTEDGELRHPKPKNQYPIDPESIQVTDEVEDGNDWMYLGAFRNEKTNVTVFEGQRSRYTLFKKDLKAYAKDMTDLRISGYGVAENLTVSQVQKVHSGPFRSIVNSTSGYDILQHSVDTTPGNSGSAIVDLRSGRAIGIHTTGGCSHGSGVNYGTLITNPNLKKALKNPKGVCKNY
jgi:V8-like Glu-specific endopeptidase